MRGREQEGKRKQGRVCARGDIEIDIEIERLRKLIANVKSINTSYIFVIDLFLNLI